MALKIDGEALRGLREQNGWTMQEFADVAKVNYTYLSKLETGAAKRPRPSTVLKLAEVLDVDPDAITGDKKLYAAARKAAKRDPRALRPTSAAA